MRSDNERMNSFFAPCVIKLRHLASLSQKELAKKAKTVLLCDTKSGVIIIHMSNA